MPLTKKGAKIMASMMEQYGMKKGKEVFYASVNAGKIKGVEGKKKSHKKKKKKGKSLKSKILSKMKKRK